MSMSEVKNRIKFKSGIIDPKMKDHGNHPFFVKSNEASKRVIEKYGLPREWIEEMKKSDKEKSR